MQNDGIVESDKKGIIICTVGFERLTLFGNITVVDVGSSPTTSTAARTLAML